MSKYSVVTTHNGTRSYASTRANTVVEYTKAQAVTVAKRTHAYYQTHDLAAKIEIIVIKANGQHGDTVAEYYAIPSWFGK